MYKEINANFIENYKQYDVLIHCCNCQCDMTGEIDSLFKEYIPQSYLLDQKTIPNDLNKLGTYKKMYDTVNRLYIVNIYTHIKSDDVINKVALLDILRELNLDFIGKNLCIPNINNLKDYKSDFNNLLTNANVSLFI